MHVPTDAELGVLARDVGQRLQQAALQLVSAESCSGGWIAKAMTDVAGSSAFFDCGMVVYSYEAKQRLLGVRAHTLEQFGAVSRETVLEMVSGALINS
ncbi:nicotinamide-nucleotide amidohydrolase family protein, partial [Stenotrophomonas sp. HMWF003]